MNFSFATAGRIVFGQGTLSELPNILSSLGKRPLLVVGGSRDRSQPIENLLTAGGYSYDMVSIIGEPSVNTIKEGRRTAADHRADCVVAIGGGSVIDGGKAICALMTNPGDPMDYLEIVGKGQSPSVSPAPFVAIPTTAGTGAEVTRNAVISVPEHQVKVSMRSPKMLPDVAVVDPLLTVSMPPAVTASTGLDALTQLIEAYISTRANPLTDSICVEGLHRAGRSLERAFLDGSDLTAREDMCIASLFGGLALANAGLGAVHGFAGPIGGMFDAPHGTICGCLLGPVFRTNVAALKSRAPGDPGLKKMDTLGQMLTGIPSAQAQDGVRWIEDLCHRLSPGSLRSFGITPAHFEQIAEKAASASSMKGNPVDLTLEELIRILEDAL